MAIPAGRIPRPLLAIAVAGIVAALAALPATRWLLRRWESNPVLRGRLLAEAQGCYGCHYPFGATEVPNPGSRWGSVPRFAAGNALMYAESCTEIGEFIRLGAPRAWLDDPAVAERLAGQHLRMPAYSALLGERDLADLTAFACAVEGVEQAAPEAPGRALAHRHGCLACHGVEGSGGLPNPRSLGGFIPGFLGGNFPDLVESREEFHEWVRHGTSSRLARNPLLRRFWRRQAIAMPAYGDRLSAEEIDQIWSWIAELRAAARPDARPDG